MAKAATPREVIAAAARATVLSCMQRRVFWFLLGLRILIPNFYVKRDALQAKTENLFWRRLIGAG